MIAPEKEAWSPTRAASSLGTLASAIPFTFRFDDSTLLLRRVPPDVRRAVLAHLGEFRLEPRKIRRLGCLSGWGRVAFPKCAPARLPRAADRPTDRPTGSESNSKAGSDQTRMRCMTHFDSKVKPRDMQWASPVPDTRGVRNATRTVNAKRNRTVWGSMLRRV